ncbi:MAG: hypothetical protein IJ647_07715 [Prevotella sp.]|nr:hypothetical protein [Prevotella sp.]
MVYIQKIIFREPGLIHGLTTVASVINDAVANGYFPNFSAISQQLVSGCLPLPTEGEGDVGSNLREDSSSRDIETATDR